MSKIKGRWIENDAITGEKILDGSIKSVDIASESITLEKLDSNVISVLNSKADKDSTYTQSEVELLIDNKNPSCFSVSAANSISTSSANFSDIDQMSLQLTSGNYIAIFNGRIGTDGANTSAEICLVADNEIIPNSTRQIRDTATVLGLGISLGTNNSSGGHSIITTVELDTPKEIKAQFRAITGGQIIISDRNLICLRVN